MEFKKTTGYLLFSRLKQWKVLLPMLFFDFLFFISLYSVATVFDTIFGMYENALVGSWKGYLLFLLYMGVVVFAYSFFKYCVLYFMMIFWDGEKEHFTFSRLKDLYVYDLLTFFVFLSIFLTLVFFFSAALVEVLKQPAVPLFIAVFLVIAYLFLQISHTVFIIKKDIPLKDIPKTVWGIMSWKFFGHLLSWNVVFGILFFLIYGVLFIFLREAMQRFMIGQNWVFIVYGLNVLIFLLFVLCGYFFLLWNRLYLYKCVQQELELDRENNKI